MREKLIEILNEIDDIFLRVPKSEIKPEHSLVDDLGLDSLGRISLFHEINYEFNCDNEEQLANEWKTIGDVLHYMESLK